MPDKIRRRGGSTRLDGSHGEVPAEPGGDFVEQVRILAGPTEIRLNCRAQRLVKTSIHLRPGGRIARQAPLDKQTILIGGFHRDATNAVRRRRTFGGRTAIGRTAGFWGARHSAREIKKAGRKMRCNGGRRVEVG